MPPIFPIGIALYLRAKLVPTSMSLDRLGPYVIRNPMRLGEMDGTCSGPPTLGCSERSDGGPARDRGAAASAGACAANHGFISTYRVRLLWEL